MKLGDHSKDLLEDLLKHDGFTVLENIAEDARLSAERKLAAYTTDVDETNRMRGEIKALGYLSREALTRKLRDTP